MKRSHTRASPRRWRTVGSAALALAAVAIIGFTTVAPAKADYDDWRWRRNWHEREWRERDWREHHRHAYGYFYSYPSYSYRSYGYYSYPSYGYSYPYGGYSYDYYR